MAPNERTIAEKVRQHDLLPVQWDRSVAWEKLQGDLPQRHSYRRYAVAACITFLALVVFVNDRKTEEKTIDAGPIPIPMEVKTSLAESTMQTCPEKKVVKDYKMPAANLSALQSVTGAVDGGLTNNELNDIINVDTFAIAKVDDAALTALSDMDREKTLEPQKKSKLLFGIVPAHSDPLAVSSGPKLVFMHFEKENMKVKRTESKLVLARIK
jgi:hypothetical protein